jgi:crotonobetainyl-CoA:carnitine CoA-transferase CaiB-like acyl-CoA transferase
VAEARASSANPRVIYCSISGYGSTGPRAELGGYDLIAQAYGGLMSVTGEPDGPPMRAGYSVVDMFAGMAAYSAIVTALVQRERTNQGAFVETSLLDAIVSQMSYHAVGHLATGKIPGPLGTASPSLVPYQLFEASDAKMIVACNSDDAYRRLCKALARADLAEDPRFATNAERLANKPALIQILSEIFHTRTVAVWCELLDAHHVPCSKIHNVADVVRDSQVAARELLPEVPHPTIEGLRAPAAPFRFGGGGAVAASAPPALGEHTDAVLRELGYSTEAIQALRAAGALG